MLLSLKFFVNFPYETNKKLVTSSTSYKTDQASVTNKKPPHKQKAGSLGEQNSWNLKGCLKKKSSFPTENRQKLQHTKFVFPLKH